MYNSCGFLVNPEKSWSRYFEPLQTLHGEQMHDKFGSALAAHDLNNDDAEDIVVGSPFWTATDCRDCGKVSIYTQSRETSRFHHHRDIFGSRPLGRFGFALAIHDIDRDQMPDLLISAPFGSQGDIYHVPGDATATCRDVHLEISNTSALITSEMKSFGLDSVELFGYSMRIVPGLNALDVPRMLVSAPKSALLYNLPFSHTFTFAITVPQTEYPVYLNNATCIANPVRKNHDGIHQLITRFCSDFKMIYRLIQHFEI